MTATIAAAQLEFPITTVAALDSDALLVLARSAVDLDRRPGFAQFTSGVVTVQQATAERVVLATDNRWAATAIRRVLRDADHAVEGDHGNETTTVAVRLIGESNGDAAPKLELTEQRDKYGRSSFLLSGPDGAIEQQCGSGGHNDMIVHARHPFWGAALIDCDRHGPGCWVRSGWPYQMEARRFVRLETAESGFAWVASPRLRWRLGAIYRAYVHQTRPSAT